MKKLKKTRITIKTAPIIKIIIIKKTQYLITENFNKFWQINQNKTDFKLTNQKLLPPKKFLV